MTEAATLAGTPAAAPLTIKTVGIMTTFGYQDLAVAAIEASPTNPRKTFDAKKLEELTESVKQHGVLEPVLVRPHPKKRGRYELIAGERRWRASKAAKVATIPAIVKDLDDLTTLEVQVVENLQREDIHPLEEAEGYEALKSKHGFTPEQLAAKVGKSKAYIYARLKLCALSPDAREVFMGGELDASTALLVARIPVPELQVQALKEIMTGGEWLREEDDEDQDDGLGPEDEEGYDDSERRAPMSYRRAAEHVRMNYMLRLDRAPFDVKQIYFCNPQGGAVSPCGECPKRTGSQPELFGDVSNDSCTDPGCFNAKRDAHAREIADKARAEGREVLVGEDARKVLKQSWSDPKGMYRLDRICHADGKHRTWEKTLGKAAKDKIVLVEHPDEPATFVECIRHADAEAILEAKGVDAQQVRHPTVRPMETKFTADMKIKLETEWQTYLALREEVGRNGITNADLRAIAKVQLSVGGDVDEDLAPYWGLDKNHRLSDAEAALDKADGAQLLQMVFDLLVGSMVGCHRSQNKVPELAAAHGIDMAAIEAKVREELKAKEKAEKAGAKAKGKKVAKGEEGEA